jgi:hypothetical protein
LLRRSRSSGSASGARAWIALELAPVAAHGADGEVLAACKAAIFSPASERLGGRSRTTIWVLAGMIRSLGNNRWLNSAHLDAQR